MFDFFGMPYEMKFFVWGRKIEDEVKWKEEMGHSKEKIKEYLQKCADKREKYLDPYDLTETEEYYTEKIHPIFEDYEVADPIYDILFKR